MKLSLISFLVFFLLSFSSANAQINEQALFTEDGSLLLKTYVFSNEIPTEIARYFETIVDNQKLNIVNGAALVKQPDQYVMEDDPASYGSFSALLQVIEDGEARLFSLSCIDGNSVQITDYNNKFLRQNNGAFIDFAWPEELSYPVFCIHYIDHQGNCLFDLFSFSGNRIWEMIGHGNTTTGIMILSTPSRFIVTTSNEKYQYARLQGLWLDYMTSIDDFPISLQECAQHGTKVDQYKLSMLTTQYGYTIGAHLRESPAFSSHSICQYSSYVPLTYLGETQIGDNELWMHVRIGNTEGWMSDRYVRLGCTLPQFPLVLGTIEYNTVLIDNLDALENCISIPQGTIFHILGETDDGYLHICVPNEQISWHPDSNGTFGFIRNDGIIKGYSLSEVVPQN